MFRIAFFILLIASQAAAQKIDLIIKNGKIIDGTGNPWFYADVAVNKGKIVKVGRIAGLEAIRPHAYASGFQYVLVNGTVTATAAGHTGARNGQVIRGN